MRHVRPTVGLGVAIKIRFTIFFDIFLNTLPSLQELDTQFVFCFFLIDECYDFAHNKHGFGIMY